MGEASSSKLLCGVEDVFHNKPAQKMLLEMMGIQCVKYISEDEMRSLSQLCSVSNFRVPLFLLSLWSHMWETQVQKTKMMSYFSNRMSKKKSKSPK